jgi:hypothetical protein
MKNGIKGVEVEVSLARLVFFRIVVKSMLRQLGVIFHNYLESMSSRYSVR